MRRSYHDIQLKQHPPSHLLCKNCLLNTDVSPPPGPEHGEGPPSQCRAAIALCCLWRAFQALLRTTAQNQGTYTVISLNDENGLGLGRLPGASAQVDL